MPELILWPEILASRREQERMFVSLRLPGQLAYFTGHFPGHPILPGVVQIHWAVRLFLQNWQGAFRFQRMEVIKFRHLLVPEAMVGLQLDFEPNELKLCFEYRNETRQFSSGRIYWRLD